MPQPFNQNYAIAIWDKTNSIEELLNEISPYDAIYEKWKQSMPKPEVNYKAEEKQRIEIFDAIDNHPESNKLKKAIDLHWIYFEWRKIFGDGYKDVVEQSGKFDQLKNIRKFCNMKFPNKLTQSQYYQMKQTTPMDQMPLAFYHLYAIDINIKDLKRKKLLEYRQGDPCNIPNWF